MKHTARWGLLGLSLALSACAALEGDKIDYKSATKAPTLEVPPDLTQLAKDSRYAVPGSGTVSASVLQSTPRAGISESQGTGAQKVGDVRIERDGAQRWLVVDRPADALWEPVRQFWLDSGFNLNTDQRQLGLLETDWAENRAKLPQDMIRATLGKLFDNLYSTGERDKFRTRLERSASGGTEIYISHRGMVEVYTSTAKDNTIWQQRPSDPELETEFLRRLMVKLGVSQEQSQALAAVAAQAPTKRGARLVTTGTPPSLELDDGFDRAWRRVGLALDRTGFTVEDRNRNEGLFFVRYVAPEAQKKDTGFFSKLLGGNDAVKAPLKYRIAVRGTSGSSQVLVLNEAGQAESSANAERILRVLAEDLK